MSICFSSAKEIAQLIEKKEISTCEVIEMFVSQINKVNPMVNAIVSLQVEKAMEQAKKVDLKISKGEKLGVLEGLPVAIKDTHHAVGFPTTFGSSIFKDFMPERDDILVERLKAAGAIVIGKTNVPEFAAGSHTYNKLFGTTKNPYDLSKTAGGSSGGAAAAVASGMLPFADGSDMGGSCRFPAAFNNVVGLRPSPGRIPIYSEKAPYSWIGVHGTIARSVQDVGLLMSVMSGPDKRSPISLDENCSGFLSINRRDLKGLKVAFTLDFGGQFPVEPEIKENFYKQIKVFEELGAQVEEVHPDLYHAEEVFQTLRALQFDATFAELHEKHSDLLNPNLVGNIIKGKTLSSVDIKRALAYHGELFHEVSCFFNSYDVLLAPVSQLAPFDAALDYPKFINNTPMTNYIDWMRSSYYISATGSPALSVPCGFTAAGLPIGLQIIGPHRSDVNLLNIGYVYEQATGYGKRYPEIAIK